MHKAFTFVACSWTSVSDYSLAASPAVAYRPSLKHAEASTQSQTIDGPIEAARKALTTLPRSNAWANSTFSRTACSRAFLYLEKALQINPQDYNTGYDLSLAYLNSGDIANASTQLHTMIAQHETAELDNLLAEVNEKSGDYKTAALEYHRAAELDPSEDNIFDLASFLLQHSNYEGFLDKCAYRSSSMAYKSILDPRR